jgi:hypothetical membrane protein
MIARIVDADRIAATSVDNPGDHERGAAARRSAAVVSGRKFREIACRLWVSSLVEVATAGVPPTRGGAMTITTATASVTCDRATRVTKSLLGYGVIAGPLYVATALAQALTREGFDLRRHQWSLLANGDLGWIQIANFVLTGLMVITFAAGLRRTLDAGPGSSAPRLIAVYGLSLVAAGVFRADPALGFPAGTPDGPAPISWHGIVHFAAGAVGFTCLAIACFAVARRYAAQARRGWAVYSRLTGIVFLAGFAMVASGRGSAAANLAFTAAVVLVFCWLAAVAADRYHHAA